MGVEVSHDLLMTRCTTDHLWLLQQTLLKVPSDPLEAEACMRCRLLLLVSSHLELPLVAVLTPSELQQIRLRLRLFPIRHPKHIGTSTRK